jgi:hypothetical protein
MEVIIPGLEPEERERLEAEAAAKARGGRRGSIVGALGRIGRRMSAVMGGSAAAAAAAAAAEYEASQRNNAEEKEEEGGRDPPPPPEEEGGESAADDGAAPRAPADDDEGEEASHPSPTTARSSGRRGSVVGLANLDARGQKLAASLAGYAGAGARIQQQHSSSLLPDLEALAAETEAASGAPRVQPPTARRRSVIGIENVGAAELAAHLASYKGAGAGASSAGEGDAAPGPATGGAASGGRRGSVTLGGPLARAGRRGSVTLGSPRGGGGGGGGGAGGVGAGMSLEEAAAAASAQYEREQASAHLVGAWSLALLVDNVDADDEGDDEEEEEGKASGRTAVKAGETVKLRLQLSRATAEEVAAAGPSSSRGSAADSVPLSGSLPHVRPFGRAARLTGTFAVSTCYMNLSIGVYDGDATASAGSSSGSSSSASTAMLIVNAAVPTPVSEAEGRAEGFTPIQVTGTFMLRELGARGATYHGTATLTKRDPGIENAPEGSSGAGGGDGGGGAGGGDVLATQDGSGRVEIVGSAVGARRGRRFSVTTGGMAAAAAAAAAAGLQDGKGE